MQLKNCWLIYRLNSQNRQFPGLSDRPGLPAKLKSSRIFHSAPEPASWKIVWSFFQFPEFKNPSGKQKKAEQQNRSACLRVLRLMPLSVENTFSGLLVPARPGRNFGSPAHKNCLLEFSGIDKFEQQGTFFFCTANQDLGQHFTA